MQIRQHYSSLRRGPNIVGAGMHVSQADPGREGAMRSQCSGAVLCIACGRKNGSGRPFPSQRTHAGFWNACPGEANILLFLHLPSHLIRVPMSGDLTIDKCGILPAFCSGPANGECTPVAGCMLWRNCGASSVATPFPSDLICCVVVLWTYCELE